MEIKLNCLDGKYTPHLKKWTSLTLRNKSFLLVHLRFLKLEELWNALTESINHYSP